MFPILQPNRSLPKKNIAAARPKKTRYPARFNWPQAESIHPAEVARTEIQIQIRTNGSKDIQRNA